jgi:hypothetical protein
VLKDIYEKNQLICWQAEQESHQKLDLLTAVGQTGRKELSNPPVDKFGKRNLISGNRKPLAGSLAKPGSLSVKKGPRLEYSPVNMI